MKNTKASHFIALLIILLAIFLNYLVIDYSTNIDIAITITEYRILLIVILLSKMLLGISFGLDSFLLEIRKKGKIKMDISKLVIIGIPSLIISLIPSIVGLGILPYYFGSDISSIIPFFQILLGYIIISSFYKYYED
jgi:hypothetical protein